MAILADKIEIKIDGKTWNNYVFSDIHLVQEIQKSAELRFRMHKNTLAEDEKELRFTLSRDLLGKKVEYVLTTLRTDAEGNKHEDKLEFNGIIFDVNAIRSSMGAGLFIEVMACSPDYLLNDSPHCYSYEEETLKNIVDEIVKPYDIQVENSPAMSEPIPYVVQYNETNYQFINRLAQRFGEWLYYDGKKLVFGKLKKQECVELYPDFDILNYRYQLDLEHLKVQHAAHNYLDYSNTAHLVSDAAQKSMHNLTDICYNSSDQIYKKETFQTLHSAIPEENQLEETEHSAKVLGWGKKAQLMVCQGHTNRADLKIGSIIKIKEFYNNGKDSCLHDELLICKITHSADSNEKYENDFFAIPANSEYPPYSFNDLYPHCEAQRAVVTDNKDPEKLGRVRVQFLWQKEQNENLMTPWLRIAQPHGGGDKGFYFVPEIEEEVIVGFENGNAEKPYIIGTLWQGEQKPADSWYSDTDDIKAIRTRNGHTVEIHDAGEGGFIRIYDNEEENYILTYSTDEKLIKLESKGNIELYAENDIIMEAANNINIKAGVDMTRDAGENITETAGEKISQSAGEDFSIEAGNDMKTGIGNNYEKTIGENAKISVGNNMQTIVSEKLTTKANNILQVSEQKTQLYSDTCEQKADSALKLDGGNSVDIYADNIKIS
jgi:uncharacterized protein involved in type VI secretion and phage assembly